MKKTTKTTKTKALTPAKKAATAAKPKTKAAPAVKKNKIAKATPVTTAPATTTISALIDVGFGNALYLRGEGPGLSWDQGLPMDCVADAEWSLIVHDAAAPLTFKFLLNDQTWCTGADYTLAPGKNGAFTPEF
ncbi:MAG: hypothetical protein IT582_04050 [Opitutaceae bacterium]|nr:hypothetical protein [Opitutaceae bacterium]